jgi:hypothetical protein
MKYEKMGRKELWSSLQHCTSISQERLWKTTKNQASQSLNRDLNPEPPERQVGAVMT